MDKSCQIIESKKIDQLIDFNVKTLNFGKILNVKK